MSKSIFSYLISYVPTDKRESKEDYLTQMFAWILDNVEGAKEKAKKGELLFGTIDTWARFHSN